MAWWQQYLVLLITRGNLWQVTKSRYSNLSQVNHTLLAFPPLEFIVVVDREVEVERWQVVFSLVYYREQINNHPISPKGCLVNCMYCFKDCVYHLYTWNPVVNVWSTVQVLGEGNASTKNGFRLKYSYRGLLRELLQLFKKDCFYLYTWNPVKSV